MGNMSARRAARQTSAGSQHSSVSAASAPTLPQSPRSLGAQQPKRTDSALSVTEPKQNETPTFPASNNNTIRRLPSSQGPHSVAATPPTHSTPRAHVYGALKEAAAQTDSTYPSSELLTPATEILSKYHTRQYAGLMQMREHVRGVMTELGCAVYDLTALKDIFLKMSESLPGAPVTDLLLVSSRVSRRAGDISRCLGAMFAEVFADDFVDDDFSFTEARIMKKRIRELEEQLATTTRERNELAAKHEALSSAAKHHRQTVDELHDDNDALSQRNAVLEDNMAVLFQQLASDFSLYNESQMAVLREDLAVQDTLASARAQFAQSVEAVQSRLRFFQTTLNELQTDVSMYDPTGALKSKIKSLDVHATHLSNRFAAVREGLMNTADELATVLQEKRRLIGFSLQHLKTYEIQNQRMRSARQLMHEVRQQLSELNRVFTNTFSSGAVVKIDRNGEIFLSAATDSGAADASGVKRSRFAAQNTRSIADLVKNLVDLGGSVTNALSMDEEHRAVLKAITLAVPSSGRPNDNTAAGGDDAKTARGAFEGSSTALAEGLTTSSGFLQNRRASAAAAHQQQQPTAGVAPTSPGAGAAAGSDAAAYVRLREDFSVKASFLREVYEERISDLESKVEQLQKKLVAAKRETDEVQNQLARALEGIIARGGGEGIGAGLDDRTAATRTKDAWLRHKAATLGAHGDAANDALHRLAHLELQSAEKAYSSPFATVAKFARPPPLTDDVVHAAAVQRPAVALPASSGRGKGGAELLRTEHSRKQHEQNVEVIRKLQTLATGMEAMVMPPKLPPANL